MNLRNRVQRLKTACCALEQWDDTKLSEVMTGPTDFNWSLFEAKLATAASPGHQFFETRLRAAGALDNWRTQPIGGEVRPEVWSCLFHEPPCVPPGEEFDRCVTATHASWLCHEGVLEPARTDCCSAFPIFCRTAYHCASRIKRKTSICRAG